ncbi:MAG: CinA family nicotinamide mononucleotide deamidase-related protein [Anaerolineales bacterium]
MNAEIISIGTEILLGEITDTNATWIARQLRDSGINLYYVTAIGDNQARITTALRQGLQRSDVILTTGGLGPTVDDMTRASVADATDRELVFHQHLLDAIARRFESFGVTMTDNNRRQAYIPAQATILENPTGTAPSFIVEHHGKLIISLPGVPREMKHIMTEQVLPFLRARMGMPAIITARILHTAGIGESLLDEKIGDLMNEANPTVGLAAHSGQTDIRITARADDAARANTLLDGMEAQVRQRAGDVIFGVDDDTLLDALRAVLTAREMRLALAEAGTGGAVAAYLNLQPHDAPHIAPARHYASVIDVKSELALGDASLDETAAATAAHLCAADDIHAALVVLRAEDGLAAFAIQTPDRTYKRSLHVGDMHDVARWAGNWGMGTIWRFLKNNP